MRRLDADEAALWMRVMETVRPLRAVAVNVAHPSLPATSSIVRAESVEALSPRTQGNKGGPSRLPAGGGRAGHVSTGAGRAVVGGNALDGAWDKRILRGAIQPDSTIDLHGHTLRSAHAMLDQGIERAITRGDRVLLLVTGKPPRAESERPHARGAIRATVGDWIAASRHAGAIAAVRGAHPRHGGAGAIYLILKRSRANS